MNVLIIDVFPQNFLDGLSALPVQVTYVPSADRQEVLRLIPGQEVLILNSKVRVDHELIDAASKLRLILRAGVGLDHFDLEYLEQKGIKALNCAGANADAVGEQTVGMLITLRHNLLRADAEVRQFVWKREANRGYELTRKTVGIIGYGNTGSAVARRLSGFGCRMLAYDKYKTDYSDAFVEEVELERIFVESDVLTFHVPLTEETRNWAGDDFFSKFHKPIVLLNLARGPIVDIAALLRALDSGKVTAAALDVLPNEKFDTLGPEERALYEDLFSRTNVMLSPHIGGWTFESLENINQRILHQLEGFLV